MTEGRRPTLDSSFFDGMYADTHDPWGFESRPYEAEKYAATLDALPRDRYRIGFEIGCSVGVLTEMLADRCEALLAVDIVEAPLVHARRRCQHLSHVRFQQMQVPHVFPDETFDLIMLSEVAYYWAGEDFQQGIDQIIEHLEPDGHLVMVHWRPFVEEYPLTGDQVHDIVLSSTSESLAHLTDRRQDLYRMDVFQRR
jgi:trans-aconitate methyltransferase